MVCLSTFRRMGIWQNYKSLAIKDTDWIEVLKYVSRMGQGDPKVIQGWQDALVLEFSGVESAHEESLLTCSNSLWADC